MMNKCGGFVLLTALTLTPLVIVASVGVAGALWFLQKKELLLHSCEKNILLIQEILTQGENQILALNSSARSLIAAKQRLDILIAAAPTPAAKLALTAQRLQVLLQMQRLRLRQRLLWQATEVRAQKSRVFGLQVLQKEIKKILSTWGRRPLQSRSELTPARLKLVAVYLDPLLPIYEARPDFSQQQRLTAHWSIQGASLFPSWMTPLFASSFQWTEGCSSHPRKENGLWRGFLGTGKPWLNS